MPLSLAQLRKLCRQSGLPGCASMDREELLSLLKKNKAKITASSLKEACCKSGMKGCSKLTKQDLLQRCLSEDAAKPTVVKKAAVPASVKGQTASVPVYRSEELCRHTNEAEHLPQDNSCPLPYNFVPGAKETNTSKEHLLWLASWYEPSVTLSHPTAGLCQLINGRTVSQKWLQKQQSYIDSHPYSSLLNDYSRHGDRVMNAFLRGDLKDAIQRYSRADDIRKQLRQPRLFNSLLIEIVTPEHFTAQGKKVYGGNVAAMKKGTPRKPINSKLFTQDFFKLLFSTAAERLQQMIQQAPSLDRDVILFRGDSTWKHLKQGQANRVQGFYSTSLSPSIATSFGAKSLGGLISRIMVPKGTHCLAVLNSHVQEESEIIFPTGSLLTLTSCEESPLALFESPWTPGDISLCSMIPKITVCTVQLST